MVTDCEKNIKLIQVFKQLGSSLQEIRTLILLEKQPWTEECNTNTSDLFANKRTAIQKKIEFFTFALQSFQIINARLFSKQRRWS